MRAALRTALLLTVGVLPAPLLGQGLTIQSTVDTRLQGALGTIANIAGRLGGDNMHDTPQTMYVSGHKLRTESTNTATIIDADAGRILTIDNKERTYTSMTFDELAAAMRTAQQNARSGAMPSSSASAPGDASAKSDLNVKYKVETDRTGQVENIAGYAAERMLLTITLQGEAKPESGKSEEVGSLVLLLDQWISKDAPQAAAMADFQRAYAKKAGKVFKEQVQGLQGVFTADPRLKGGVEAAATEMGKLQGTPLRTVMYFTLVPAGTAFDRAAALTDGKAASPDDKPKGGGGLGGMFGRLKAAAQEAGKGDGSKPAGPPKQATLATVTDEVRSITAGAVAADLFAPPVGYREVKPPQGRPN